MLKFSLRVSNDDALTRIERNLDVLCAQKFCEADATLTAGSIFRYFLEVIISALLIVSPAFADDVIPPKVEISTPWGVSMTGGYFQLDSVDLSIGDLKLERFAQSPSNYWPDNSQFGYGQTSNFDIYVEANLVKASGPPYNLPNRYYTWVHLGNRAIGTYLAPYPLGSGSISTLSKDAQSGSLSWSGSSYKFVDEFGNIYIFNPSVTAHPTGLNYGTTIPKSQKIDHIDYANGRVRQFYYDSSQRLKLVTDSTGYSILFDYGSNGFVSDACGIKSSQTYVTVTSSCPGLSNTVSYKYGTSSGSSHVGTVAVLTGFTDVLGNTTSYQYASGLSSFNPAVSCLMPPGYSTCQIAFVSDSNGSRTILGDGTIASGLHPNPTGMDPINGDPTSSCGNSGGVTYPDGTTITMTYTQSSPCQITDQSGKITTYQWTGSTIQEPGAIQMNDGSLLYQAVFPEGNSYTVYHNAAFNAVSEEIWKAKPNSGQTDIDIFYNYSAVVSGFVIAKPTSRTDANGNITNWSYTSSGDIMSELAPAPAAGGARPLKLWSYVQRYAWVKSSSGALVQEATPIWVVSTETECQTVAGSNPAPSCDSGAPVRVTTYEYGANGTGDSLLVKGIAVTADGQTRRRCYSYDDLGRKISETSPMAGLTSCP